MYGIIYDVYNKQNGKHYIGQTIHTLEKRKRVHYSKYSNCSYFRHALEKYDKEDWIWTIIDQADSSEELDNKEQYWIKYYDCKNPDKGYNLTDGGQGSRGAIISEENKRKTRESMLKATMSNYSKKNSKTKPVKCVETGKSYFSISEAAQDMGICTTSIQKSLKDPNNDKEHKYHWVLLEGKERLKYLPNALYCVELDKIYDNVRQARIEDRFHEGNLGKAMLEGEPEELKKYAGYTFYWVNPDFH